ncbi:MAG TPA: neutral zinc metallopeptidase [Methylophilaceae bacterium]|jgi:predicted metalloprotease|nr:neutral zinc metallopeptidase [Methylophilaceae bacterium]
MRLGGQRASKNVEDRRGMGVKGGLGVGGIVIALIAYFLGFDPGAVLTVAEQVAPQRETGEASKGAPTDEMGQFVSKVLGSTEDVWGGIFQQSNSQYRPPTLVLYDGQVSSACGMGQSAMGPFYCPGDEKLYLDFAFFRDLQTRFSAPGDFAQAYVIAHEVGHHVQKLTGALQKLEAARGRISQTEYNATSVRMELQADCYAGVWGYHAGTMNQLDDDDIAEALNAATAIGDDRLQKQTQGRVAPDSFTHGSSEQRVHWFKRGMDAGRPKDCDTFSTSSP